MMDNPLFSVEAMDRRRKQRLSESREKKMKEMKEKFGK